MYFAAYQHMNDRYKIERSKRRPMRVWCCDEEKGQSGLPQDKNLRRQYLQARTPTPTRTVLSSDTFSERTVCRHGSDRMMLRWRVRAYVLALLNRTISRSAPSLRCNA